MNVKENVRERRRERLKELAENPRNPTGARIDAALPPPAYYDRYTADAMHARDANDPEAAWKLREQEMGWRWADPADRRNRNRDERWKEWNAPPSGGQLRGKIVLCCILFAAVWGLFQLKQPWAVLSQQWVRHAMQREFDYEALKAWYGEHFAGTPSFLPAFGSPAAKKSDDLRVFVPAKGTAESWTAGDYRGVMVTTAPNAAVKAMTTGRVVFVGERQDTGYTVILQHASGLESVYGLVQGVSLHVNDWVKGGQTIGAASPVEGGSGGRYFFALERGSQALDPTDVIAFD